MAQIKLLRHYQNMSGQDLRPDTYDSNDPILGGLASYLVENGYAEYIANETVSHSAAVADETPKANTPTQDIPKTRKRK